MANQNAGFVLVYWLDDCLFSVVARSNVKETNFDVGAVVSVSWPATNSKKKGKGARVEWFKAKVLEISGM